ncbi:acyltransferase domain-containing protein [Nocardia abscessus]|nr:acyltransferase domain-containing protein [Nocardia abscessus]
MTLAEAIRIVVSRGRIMARAAGSGAMVAVELTHDEVAALLSTIDTSVAVAAINDDKSVVLSGTVDELHAAG